MTNVRVLVTKSGLFSVRQLCCSCFRKCSKHITQRSMFRTLILATPASINHLLFGNDNYSSKLKGHTLHLSATFEHRGGVLLLC